MVNLREASKGAHVLLQVVCFSLILSTVCGKNGCTWNWNQLTYAFSAGIITAVFAGLTLGMNRFNHRHDKAEKIIWILCHYLVFAAAVSISYARKTNTIVAACVFMWLDFAVYILELSMFLGLAKTSI